MSIPQRNISGQYQNIKQTLSPLKLYCIIQEFTSHVIVQNKIILLVKSAFKPVAHQAGAYPGFCSMKRLRVFLLPPGWDASPSQGYPLALCFPVPIYTP